MNAVRLGRAASGRFRQRATATVTRVSGFTTDSGGRKVPSVTTVYTGKCYFRYQGIGFESTFDTAGTVVVQTRLLAFMPHGTVFAVGDVVKVTAEPDTPHLVGQEYRVASIDDQSQATAQRLLLEDNQKGVKASG